jgi:uncharacterized protein YndB with AHSA1/START domain
VSDPTPSGPVVLRMERTFSAAAEAVFDAWTRAEILRRWWSPGPDWEAPIAEADVRVGGRLRIVMRSPQGEEFGGGGEYIEVTPPERLVFTWTWDGHVGHEGSQLIEVEFDDHGDGTTTVVVTNRGIRDQESRESHREGWQGSLANLERVLAAG